MLVIKRHKTFIKDLSKIKMSNQHYSKYIAYLAKLMNKEALPSEARDHCLMGE